MNDHKVTINMQLKSEKNELYHLVNLTNMNVSKHEITGHKTSEIYRVSPAYLHIKRCCVT